MDVIIFEESLDAYLDRRKENFRHENKCPGGVEDTKNSTIDILNHDCLAKVIGYLNFAQRIKVERVCRKWRYVAYNMAWENAFSLVLNSTTLGVKPFYGKFGLAEINCYVAQQILNRCAKYLKYNVKYYKYKNTDYGSCTITVVGEQSGGIKSTSSHSMNFSGISRLALNVKRFVKFLVNEQIPLNANLRVSDDCSLTDLALKYIFLKMEIFSNSNIVLQPQLKSDISVVEYLRERTTINPLLIKLGKELIENHTKCLFAFASKDSELRDRGILVLYQQNDNRSTFISNDFDEYKVATLKYDEKLSLSYYKQ